jgi:cell division protein FtsN
MVKIKNLKNKKIIVGVLALLILAGAGFYFFQKNQNSESSPQVSDPTINLDPPTEEDLQRAEDNKKEIVAEQDKSPASNSVRPASSVKPVITYADQYGDVVEVGGYISLFEENGTCTATFTQGSKQITKSVKAVRSAQSTDCPVMAVSVSEFNPRGNYSVTITYSSPFTNSTSEARQLTVR